MTLERTQVKSSNLKSVGYDQDAKTLEVEFHGGRIYEYYGVPPRVHQELMSASSLGKYHASNIKNVYACEEISG